MTRLAIAPALALALAVLVPGCHGKGAETPTTGTGSAAPVVAKKVQVSWGIQPAGEMTDLFLALTDETGKVVSHELGRWKGTCTVVTPGAEMKALTGVACRTGGTGTELHAVTTGGEEIIVVKLGTDEGVTPDPMAREEVKRIKIPLGAAIEAGR